MMRFFSTVLILTAIFAPVTFVRAESSTAYAYAVKAVSPLNVLSSNNAVGAPDAAFADFMSDDVYLTLDMGEDVVGNLTVSYYLLQYGGAPLFTFYDADMQAVASASVVLPIGQTETVLENLEDIIYRYVKIQMFQDKPWRLDAVAAMKVSADAEKPEEPVDTPDPINGPGAGDLVMNPAFSAVYVLGADGSRHAFPNEAVFKSWNFDFDDVIELSAEELAEYPLGKNVRMKSGSALVKLQSDARVYAVAPGGELRWVSSESLAVSLFGPSWAKTVVDIADVFWFNYSQGDVIDETSDLDGWEEEMYPY